MGADMGGRTKVRRRVVRRRVVRKRVVRKIGTAGQFGAIR